MPLPPWLSRGQSGQRDAGLDDYAHAFPAGAQPPGQRAEETEPTPGWRDHLSRNPENRWSYDAGTVSTTRKAGIMFVRQSRSTHTALSKLGVVHKFATAEVQESTNSLQSVCLALHRVCALNCPSQVSLLTPQQASQTVYKNL